MALGLGDRLAGWRKVNKAAALSVGAIHQTKPTFARVCLPLAILLAVVRLTSQLSSRLGSSSCQNTGRHRGVFRRVHRWNLDARRVEK